MKYVLIAAWLSIILSGISYIFWQNEVKYTLPTPIPAKYQPVEKGTHIQLTEKLCSRKNVPVFIHFFNPACPCSRFNIPYFRTIARQYRDKVSFAVVVLGDNKKYSETEIQDKLGVDIPVLFDSSVAAACGVYSTPQAVLLDKEHKLYYRGNYNKSRYCTDPVSNYAQQAIDSLLNNNFNPNFDISALKAYGCELPVCNK